MTAVALGAVTISVAGAGSASAAIITKQKTSQVPDMGVTTAVAGCPPRTQLLSGGFSAPKQLDAVVFTSRRVSPRSWEVAAADGGGSLDDFTSYAYCRTGARRKLRAVRETISIPPGPITPTVRTVTATCPPGRKAVAGGFDGQVDLSLAGTQILDSRRQGRRSWAAEAANDSATAQPFSVIAYCARKGRKKVSNSAVPSSQGTDVVATCPQGKVSTSGGFQVSPYDLSNSAVVVTTSRRQGRRGWLINAFAVNSLSPGSAKVFGYCRG